MNKNKIFTFKYDPSATPQQMFTKLWTAVDTGTKSIQSNNVMIANRIETIYRVASPARIDLLTCLSKEKPNNIQDLAQLLHRDYANVWRDTQALVGLGIIQLEKNGKQNKPIALYDRIVFDLPIRELSDRIRMVENRVAL
jgi:predicted transcriptional regulator